MLNQKGPGALLLSEISSRSEDPLGDLFFFDVAVARFGPLPT